MWQLIHISFACLFRCYVDIIVFYLNLLFIWLDTYLLFRIWYYLNMVAFIFLLCWWSGLMRHIQCIYYNFILFVVYFLLSFIPQVFIYLLIIIIEETLKRDIMLLIILVFILIFLFLFKWSYTLIFLALLIKYIICYFYLFGLICQYDLFSYTFCYFSLRSVRFNWKFKNI